MELIGCLRNSNDIWIIVVVTIGAVVYFCIMILCIIILYKIKHERKTEKTNQVHVSVIMTNELRMNTSSQSPTSIDSVNETFDKNHFGFMTEGKRDSFVVTETPQSPEDDMVIQDKGETDNGEFVVETIQ